MSMSMSMGNMDTDTDTMSMTMESESMDMDSMSGHHGGYSYFNTGYKTLTLLFKGFDLDTSGAYAGALIFTFFLAVTYEILKSFRFTLDEKFQEMNLKAQEKTDQIPTKDVQTKNKTYYTIPQQVCRSLIHGFAVFVSMLLMLIFMTFDAGLCVMVCFGAAIGFGVARRSTRQCPEPVSSCCPEV